MIEVGVGKINAIAGKRLHYDLDRTEQNYLVCPSQPWLGGINAGEDYVRLFVAMPVAKGQVRETDGQGRRVVTSARQHIDRNT